MPNIPEIKIGNTTYKLKDGELRNNIVLAQDTQPTNENNRIWLQENSEDRQVPTWEEFSDVESALNNNIELVEGFPVVLCFPNEFVDRSNGNFLPYTGWSRTAKIPVTGGTRLYFSGITENLTYCCFYLADGSRYNNITLNKDFGYINIPSSVAFIAISGPDTQMKLLKIKNSAFENYKATIDAEIREIGIIAEGGPTENISFVIGGVTSSGELQTTSTNNIRTDKFSPTQNCTFVFNKKTGTNIMFAVYFYNQDGTYKSYNSGWIEAPGAFIVTPEMKVVISVRYTDSSDIASISDVTNQIQSNYLINDVWNKIPEMPLNSEKYCHFSIDDTDLWYMFTTTSKESIWENSVLNHFLYLHLKYGFTVTMNCFLEISGYDISDVVTKYQNEFANNSNWMKFAFHAKAADTGYYSDDVNLAADYQKFVTAIHKMTGTYDSIDHVTRLNFFSGSLNNVLTLRDQKAGIIGLLTADDDRQSYYLTADESEYLKNNLVYFDADHQITFIHNVKRFEYEGFLTNFDTLDTANFMRFIECWSHQSHLDEVWNRIEEAFQWFVNNGYTGSFAEYHLT